MELDARVTALENIMLPLSRIFDLNDASLRPANAYGDWLLAKAKEHSYYQIWTQLDKRSLDYLYARLESVHLLMKGYWALSKTWDYQSDDKAVQELMGLHWFDFRSNMPKLKRHETMLIQDIERRLKQGEKPIHFKAYHPMQSKIDLESLQKGIAENPPDIKNRVPQDTFFY